MSAHTVQNICTILGMAGSIAWIVWFIVKNKRLIEEDKKFLKEVNKWDN